MYLDKKGLRSTRKGLKLTWQDLNRNNHDLDFVLERGGSEKNVGAPVAFIELAWRRYTKHSRNKAQEIQGAIIPLKETYRNHGPFIGVVLAGEFTRTSLEQLKSLGFAAVHFSYENVIKAFKSESLDISFDESTPDSDFKKKINQWKKLSKKAKQRIEAALVQSCQDELAEFIQGLADCINRKVQTVRILPLYGESSDLTTLEEAITFLNTYDPKSGSASFSRFEVQVRFSNEDRIDAVFGSRLDAIRFLEAQKTDSSRDEGQQLVQTVLKADLR